MELYFHWFDLLGIAVFAISGTLAAWRKQMDGFGVIVLATVTAIGGGTLRDLILDSPVIWLTNNSYFLAIFAAAILTILLVRNRLVIPNNTLQIADAIGLAFFVIMGTQKALDHGTSDFVAIMLGTMSGVCGGMIRDVLCREIPMVFRGELYAITCIFGGLVYVQLLGFGMAQMPAMLAGMVALLALRLAAIRWHLTIPVFGKKANDLR
ncbi:MAG: trimeric intracellular cation channel family protein [Gammaproteobacteria bacterium]|nr:trimeric intracellular cation channel family protein [Gammaproteobacteria bacterium]MBU2059551.1 trimeric intracellular cation channel family protein [Gammaproteobacteria bacterium]MBU2174398.1 trimeric intracellular cation channel family protein [Gammaproteobacteria bacterium]MBU2248023.1 trimeric intracellular cation channel family protein [Gammaproteobacteria bacterium]MBU2345493.1 trimeric intracellular cation channel family protein [Gammaproteobacteria bacterium]